MRTVSLHDTLTGKLEDLVPAAAPRVRIYACGPTVYSRVHVGNARPFVVFSQLKRFLSAQGYDVVFDLPRSVMGAKGLSADQIRYWDGVFQRMVKTDAWRQAVEKNQWEEDYMNSADFGKNLKAQYEILKDVLTELGMVKQ